MAQYDYLRWDAQSIQELLRRKLLESGLLTDQLYPSSDIIIEVVPTFIPMSVNICDTVGVFAKENDRP